MAYRFKFVRQLLMLLAKAKPIFTSVCQQDLYFALEVRLGVGHQSIQCLLGDGLILSQVQGLLE